MVASKNAVKINAVAAALRQALPGVQHAVAGSSSHSGVPDQPWGDEETLRGAYNRVQSIRTPQHEGSLLVAIEGGVGYAAPLPGGPPGAADAVAAPRQPWAAVWQQRRQQHTALQPPGARQQHPELECFAWVVVQAPCGAVSHARSASFPLPPAVSELMLSGGLELGDADDAVFGRRGRESRAWQHRGRQEAHGHPSQANRPCLHCKASPPARLRRRRLRRVKSGSGSGTIGKLTRGLLTRQSYYEHAALCALVPLMNGPLYPQFDLAHLPPLQAPGSGGAGGGE